MANKDNLDIFIVRIQHFIDGKRASYGKLPRVLQLLIVLATFITTILSLAIILILPEIGAPLLLLSLGVLSFEFGWAERLLLRVMSLFGNKIFIRILTVVAFVIVIALAVIWFNR